MNRKDLYKSFNEIDDDILERSEATTKGKSLRKWCTLAACLCLLIGAAVMVSGLLQKNAPRSPGLTEPPAAQSGPSQTESSDGTGGSTEGPEDLWQVTFNHVTKAVLLDAARKYIPGYFTEELSAEQLAVVVPEEKYGFMGYSGYAGFDGEGKLIDIYLTVTTTIPGDDIVVVISQSGITCDSIFGSDDEPVLSVCEGVKYEVWQYESVDGPITLTANASINGWAHTFTLKTTHQNLEQAREDFTRVLECFACYADSSPDLSSIVASEIPEWFHNVLSHKQAMEDPTYGPYMLRDVPDGFSEESISRYKDQKEDYLSGLWTRGYDEIRWKVYTICDADENRLTRVAERENYDLALYPIPRASSVPEELREVVDNPIFFAEEFTRETIWARAYKTGETGDSTGWRMEFSVRYGDVVVEVRAKGLDPDWVYEQIMALITE